MSLTARCITGFRMSWHHNYLGLTVKWRAGSRTWIWVLSPRCSTPTHYPHTPPAGTGSTASRWRTAACSALELSSWRRTRPQSSRGNARRPWRKSGSVSWQQGSELLPAASGASKLWVDACVYFGNKPQTCRNQVWHTRLPHKTDVWWLILSFDKPTTKSRSCVE